MRWTGPLAPWFDALSPAWQVTVAVVGPMLTVAALGLILAAAVVVVERFRS